MIFCLILAIAAPLGLCFLLTFRRKTTWRAILAGAVGYLVGEVLIRGAVFSLIRASSQRFDELMNVPVFNSFVTAACSAVLVMGVIYVACFVLLRRPFDHKNARGVGLGAGGVFVIANLGVDSLLSILVATYYNSGRITDIAGVLGTDQVTAMLEQFSSSSALDLVLSAFVYLIGIVVMLAAATLVVYGLRSGKHGFFLWGALVWFIYRGISVFLGYITPWFALLFAVFFGLICYKFFDLVKEVYDQTPEVSYARKKGAANQRKDISVTGGSRKKKKKKKKKK